MQWIPWRNIWAVSDHNAVTAHWAQPHAEGLYIAPADVWIDPSHPVATAVVTHGHADHARGGHGQTIATNETLAIMHLRYGTDGGTALSYHDTVTLGGVRFTLFPAGHVLGSAQILIEHDGQRLVVTGDYKRRADPTCAPFEVVPCDIFVTEATFGLPVFRHPDIGGEIVKLFDRMAREPDRTMLIGAYALGKAQRIIAELRRHGYDQPIYLHGALERMCALYERFGIDLGELRPVADTPREALRGVVVLAPPSALNDRWSRRLADPVTAMASGWMRVRQRARQRNVELPLIISDHCDWDELTTTIREVGASETWITHGSEAGLLRWCELHQIKARALHLVGRDAEEDE